MEYVNFGNKNTALSGGKGEIMLYALGGVALVAIIWYVIRYVMVYIGSAPARGEGLPEETRRYFRELERILDPFRKDADVVECLMKANEYLLSVYRTYQAHPDYARCAVLFGADSHNKNREEAWAACFLASYNDSSIITVMREKMLARIEFLATKTDACPPELYNEFWAAKDHMLRLKLEEQERRRNRR